MLCFYLVKDGYCTHEDLKNMDIETFIKLKVFYAGQVAVANAQSNLEDS